MDAELIFANPIVEQVKLCPHCGMVESRDAFNKDKTRADGLNKFCKNCLRSYYYNNRDKHIQYMKKYRKTVNGRLVGTRAAHIRRCRIKNAETTLTSTQWQKIVEMQRNKCNLCGKKFTKKRTPTVDHIVPLSKGGNLTFENIQALCISCNRRKNARLYKGFIQTWEFTG